VTSVTGFMLIALNEEHAAPHPDKSSVLGLSWSRSSGWTRSNLRDVAPKGSVPEGGRSQAAEMDPSEQLPPCYSSGSQGRMGSARR
jgi:hypothetical protein